MRYELGTYHCKSFAVNDGGFGRVLSWGAASSAGGWCVFSWRWPGGGGRFETEAKGSVKVLIVRGPAGTAEVRRSKD